MDLQRISYLKESFVHHGTLAESLQNDEYGGRYTLALLSRLVHSILKRKEAISASTSAFIADLLSSDSRHGHFGDKRGSPMPSRLLR